uniref:Uncharacterized protein n=1 Tax=Astatotilapia calliptera TaxID=8154 RepID=A0AAX7SSY6_ASTCA
MGPPGPQGPEGKPGLPGQSLGDSGRDGLDGLPGKPGMKGDQGQKGEPGPKGEKGDQGRVGIAGMPGLPGTPGRPGIDGKRGLPGKDGERGLKGDDGKKGDKGDAGADGKDGSKGEPGLPGLPGRQVLVTPEGATIDEIRQAFPMPMGPPGPTGDKGEKGLKGEKGDAGAPGKSLEMKDIETMFEAYGIKLPLLKALIDRLLQDGIEELLHVLSNSKKTKENTERHNSNVITDYKSSEKFDITSRPLSKADTFEDTDVDGQPPESFFVDPLNETAEDPTLWTVNTLNGELEHDTIETNLKETVDSTGTSFKVNLTVVNSTSNYTMTNETSEEARQDEEDEFYNGEDYSYEYEEELTTIDPLIPRDFGENRQLEVQTDEFPHPVDDKEQLPTPSPAQVETLSQPITVFSDRETDAQSTPPSATEEPDQEIS